MILQGLIPGIAHALQGRSPEAAVAANVGPLAPISMSLRPVGAPNATSPTLQIPALPPAAVRTAAGQARELSLPFQAAAAASRPAPHPQAPTASEQARAADTGAVEQVFEGRFASVTLPVVDTGRALWENGRSKKLLGRGWIGKVFPHPKVPGAVVKVIDPLPEAPVVADDAADFHADSLARLGEAGVGPRLLGRGVIFGGKPALVIEQVFGDTLEGLIEKGRLGQAERALIEDLVERMARTGTGVQDLKPANIMIGRTLRDMRRRAYVTDSGDPIEGFEAMSAKERSEAIWTLVNVEYDPKSGPVREWSLREAVNHGLEMNGPRR